MQRAAVVRNLVSFPNERPAPYGVPRIESSNNFAVAPNHQGSSNVTESIRRAVTRVLIQNHPAGSVLVILDFRLISAHLVSPMSYHSFFRVRENYMRVAIAVCVHADDLLGRPPGSRYLRGRRLTGSKQGSR